tara:strand:- start:30 stop:332 length:303 start_codon:yes stop_codon:yes gene_type:complete
MSISYNWNVSQTEYLTSDKFIKIAHWQCNAVDGEYSTSTYSTCSWANGTPSVPYANVTMAEVLDWIWASGVDKDATEASLAQQIEALKNPVTATGTPWSA